MEGADLQIDGGLDGVSHCLTNGLAEVDGTRTDLRTPKAFAV